MIKISEKLNDTNVANNLTHSTIEYDNCIRIPPNHNHIHGIEYKGATYNHIKVHTFCEKKVNISRGPQVIRLDGKNIQDTHNAELNLIPLITIRGKTAHTFPHLQTGEIISTGKLCNDDCTEKCTPKNKKVKKKVN